MDATKHVAVGDGDGGGIDILDGDGDNGEGGMRDMGGGRLWREREERFVTERTG